MDLSKRLSELEAEMLELQARVSRLEALIKPLQPNPVVFPQTPDWLSPSIQPLPASKCSKCGLEFSGPMGYCCPRTDCPTGLGPIMC